MLTTLVEHSMLSTYAMWGRITIIVGIFNNQNIQFMLKHNVLRRRDIKKRVSHPLTKKNPPHQCPVYRATSRNDLNARQSFKLTINPHLAIPLEVKLKTDLSQRYVCVKYIRQITWLDNVVTCHCWLTCIGDWV